MKTLSNKVAAITGAGSGIGRATAELFAKSGCNVALSDVNEKGLAETVEKLKAYPVKVTQARVDVADRAAMEKWADDVERDFGHVNIIINNAGVALGVTVENMSYEDLHWLMNINFWGVVHGTKAFLPKLRKAGEGHIVNLSSVFGLVAVPTQGAYNAAKFAVKGFTDALRQELEAEDAPIGVTTVHPGGIKTNIARNARMIPTPGWVHENSGRDFEKMFQTTPERAAEDIRDAVLKNRRRQLIGRDAVVIDLLARVMPSLYQKLLVSGARKRRQRALAKAAAKAKAEPDGAPEKPAEPEARARKAS